MRMHKNDCGERWMSQLQVMSDLPRSKIVKKISEPRIWMHGVAWQPSCVYSKQDALPATSIYHSFSLAFEPGSSLWQKQLDVSSQTGVWGTNRKYLVSSSHLPHLRDADMNFCPIHCSISVSLSHLGALYQNSQTFDCQTCLFCTCEHLVEKQCKSDLMVCRSICIKARSVKPKWLPQCVITRSAHLVIT